MGLLGEVQVGESTRDHLDSIEAALAPYGGASSSTARDVVSR